MRPRGTRGRELQAPFGVPLGRAPCESGSIEADSSPTPADLPPSCLMRRLLVLAGSVALVAIVVIGLTKAAAGGGATNPPDSLADAQKELSGSPQPLAALHAQANQLIGGGRPPFDQRLAPPKGHPRRHQKRA